MFQMPTESLTTMVLEPHNVMSVVLACVTLHNIIRTCYRADYQGLAYERTMITGTSQEPRDRDKLILISILKTRPLPWHLSPAGYYAKMQK